MGAGKIIGYVAGGILVFFGVLFIWGAFSPQGSAGWILIGLVSVAIGFAFFWLASRSNSQTGQANQNVTLKVELPGKVGLDSLKCQSCGGALTMDNIKLINNVPVVTCPYCKSTYQLTEEPKW